MIEQCLLHFYSRYEIFMDEVKPSDLSLNFLREYMDLPFSYFHPGAQIKYRKLDTLLLLFLSCDNF